MLKFKRLIIKFFYLNLIKYLRKYFFDFKMFMFIILISLIMFYIVIFFIYFLIIIIVIEE
jgi:hypothetical protein